MTSTCSKGFMPFLDMDALCGSERGRPPFGQTIKADLTLNLRPLIGEPSRSKIYRILSDGLSKALTPVKSLSMWSFQLPDSWGEAYSRFCEV